MKEKIINRLVSVKSIMTLVFTIVFSYLAITEKVAPESFQDIFYIIVAFYFGSQSERLNNVVK